MVVLALIAGGTLAGTAAFAVFFAQGTAFYVRDGLYTKVQTLSFGNFDRFRTSALMVRLNADVNNIANAIMYAVLLTLYAPFMVIIAFGLALIFTPSLVWILIVVAVLVLVIMALLVPRVFAAYDKRQEALDAVNNRLQENLSGIRVVKAFTREELEKERFAARATQLRKPAFSAAFMVALLNPILSGIAQISIAFAIGVGGIQLLEDQGIQVGEIVAFTQYLALVVTPLALVALPQHVYAPCALMEEQRTVARARWRGFVEQVHVRDGEMVATQWEELLRVLPDVEVDPALARRIVDEGHELGNHSVYHTPYTSSALASQIGPNQSIINNATGVTPIVSRAPEGRKLPSAPRSGNSSNTGPHPKAA